MKRFNIILSMVILVLTIVACGGGEDENPALSESPPVIEEEPTTIIESDLPPPNAQLGSTWTRPQDNMTMVYVPEGSFLMGSNDGESDDEQPVHEVSLNGFWIDLTEVTNEQFARFLNEIGNQEEGGVTWLEVESDLVQINEQNGSFSAQSSFADHPVIEVSWYGAAAYCEWAGGQLPSEAQFEYAVRGPDSLEYPWGDNFDGEITNFCDQNCEFGGDKSADDGYAEAAPVGSYQDGASWVDALDMAGNVWEWTYDWYDDSYYANSPGEDPTGPESGGNKVLRGGSWYNLSIDLRGATRLYYNPVIRDLLIGFRCSLPGN